MNRLRVINISIVLLLSCLFGMEARTISENEARNVALSFFREKKISATATMVAVRNSAPWRVKGSTATAAQPYYVFNAGESSGGFVIVSGDDRAESVLGYSDNGHYDPADIPPAMQEWLDFLSAEIEALGDVQAAPASQPSLTARTSIAPLVTSKWDQDAPYNNALKTTSDGNRAVTGCVATAMAQIMYYHKWPQKTSQTIPAYTSETQSIYMPALGISSFDWASMKNTYMGNETGTAAVAVSKLMLYCAQALEMDFKDGSSSAYTNDIAKVLPLYFNYSPTTTYVLRRGQTKTEWENLIYGQLAAKLPVVHCGSKMGGGGHSFVCDGYDGATGLFHFNWGWSGSSDGYYALDALKPEYQGIGSANGTEGYINYQGVVINIKPNDSSTSSEAMSIWYVQPKSTNYSRSSTSSSFTNVSLTDSRYNYTGEKQSFFGAWALYSTDGTFVKYLHDSSNPDTYARYVDMEYRTGEERDHKLTFDSSIANGTYYLYPISQIYGSGKWMLCWGYHSNYVKVTVADKTLTLQAYGLGGTMSYTANSVNISSNRKVGKPITITLKLSNTGTTTNDNIYLLEDDKCITHGVATMLPGEIGEVTFKYLPTTTGTKKLKYTLSEDGSGYLGYNSVTIESMAAADLSATSTIYNREVEDGKYVVKGNEFKVGGKFTNNLSTNYTEGLRVELLRAIDYNSGYYNGTVVDALERNFTLSGNASATQTFSFSDLIDGEYYWIRYRYYSEGSLKTAGQTSVYKFVKSLKGDVNGDGKVNTSDVTTLVNMILGVVTMDKNRADVDGNGTINVSDVTALVNIILGK